jgi:GDPmannose 4,6-dehydratase
MTRAFVTGIGGQDGSYLAERLLADGDQVMGVVRPPVDRELPALRGLEEDVELIAGDLEDPGGLADTIRRWAPDDVYHLAAPTFVPAPWDDPGRTLPEVAEATAAVAPSPASWDDPGRTLREVAEATAAVLLAARDTEARVLTVASPEIFGDAGGVSPQDEDAPRRPRSPYGVAKLAAHELTRVLRDRGAHACGVITYNHESPRRPERFVTRKITRAAAAISLGRQDELALGDLDARRDWSHAADVVAGLCLALRHAEPGDYVLASGVARTVRDFARAAFAAVGLDADDHVRVDPELVRPPEPTVLVGDPSRAREVLGWEPRVAFEDLVREMVEADLELLRRS